MFTFRKGTYIYAGSAKKNIRQRIERHNRINKKIHWHFDYLRPFGIITRIITYDQSFGECELAENIRKQLNGTIPVKGFGSSDCKCVSHLIFVEDNLIPVNK
ncbi:GIY-YIG nuclease family protein [Niallia endozanthoxylica]|uniref:GIY-YIG nuclease family protein n=1 Tax=Niallia endozanthoxylica TaxID=2036016 RepID=A0A5J5HMQ7_9BACI|nr:GIY-YIG nuclease family protein [Niallia endozanthoxylica]KAA9021686.1 GIY-YIG nuclease family protein [Niallia endozanthoxylica]